MKALVIVVPSLSFKGTTYANLLKMSMTYDKDLPWFNSRIKLLIENKNKLGKNYRRFKSNSQLLSKLNLHQEQLHLLINKSKQNYYAKMASKLTNVQRNSNTFGLY